MTVENYSGTHHYISTACQHFQHAKCRRTCKYCIARCFCTCHTPSTTD